jgi:hypothetical protein
MTTSTSKPKTRIDAFWDGAFFLYVILGIIVTFLVAFSVAAHGATLQLQRRTGPPIRESDCGHRLDQVRFREWTAANAEGLLRVKVGEHADAVYYYQQAQHILDDKNLNPSPAHCAEKWLLTSEVQADIMEQAYNLDVQYYKDKGLLK